MSLKKWIYFTFINLLIVAFLGLLLRYKILFSLPFIQQKYLLHGHSHFALTGWISQLLMVLMAYQVSKRVGLDYFKKYQWILIVNLIAAFGMLFSFPVQGYASVSIAFSTLSILISYVFAFQLWTDMNRLKSKGVGFAWYKAALLFSVLSSIGVFIMVYLMISRNMNPNDHLAAIYLFLHFQYNGWFVFGCFGLLEEKFQGQVLPKKIGIFFWINVLACVPAYFLSAPWLPIPDLFFILVVLSAIVQFGSWIWIAFCLRRKVVSLFSSLSFLPKCLLVLASLTYSLKVLLQLGSTIPALSNIAFGFRPVVVAYLHLVFLGVISMFLIGYVLGWVLPKISKTTEIGLKMFVIGVFLNEFALMIQGIFAIDYHMVPYINESLLGITILMFSGLIVFNLGLHQKKIGKE